MIGTIANQKAVWLCFFLLKNFQEENSISCCSRIRSSLLRLLLHKKIRSEIRISLHCAVLLTGVSKPSEAFFLAARSAKRGMKKRTLLSDQKVVSLGLLTPFRSRQRTHMNKQAIFKRVVKILFFFAHASGSQMVSICAWITECSAFLRLHKPDVNTVSHTGNFVFYFRVGRTQVKLTRQTRGNSHLAVMYIFSSNELRTIKTDFCLVTTERCSNIAPVQ